ncbi:hypothetical protein RchiOBHm_Chr5g0053451 [Rosa chinensis]|uniref:Uncharacterized protein n=1 Tax=Rosa chinensis TaxID=74649 RepID=A0A2P6QFW3_ROSCH|nr:hypothetical protein RchiOBHm_Chr5g0053451 [Rosa chinensis]
MKTRLEKTDKHSAVKNTASFRGNILLLPPGSGKRASYDVSEERGGITMMIFCSDI